MKAQRLILSPLVLAAAMAWPLAAQAVQATADLEVKLVIKAECKINGGLLDFGTVTGLGSIIDAEAKFTFICTNGSHYKVGFDLGLNPQGTQRRMKNGSYVVDYQIYKEALRTTILDMDFSPASTTVLAGTGTGTDQSLSIFGRVPVQPGVPSGVYGDKVTMTIDF